MWKIIIIDDDFQVLQGVKKIIQQETLEIEWVGEASDGREGLDKIKKLKPDIVMTDISMPVMDGLEMIEQLRDEGFSGEFIILSGYADFQLARQALRLHVNDYLSKPITIQELHQVLEKVIKGLKSRETEKLTRNELNQKLIMYEPFVRKEWLKSVAAGTLTREMVSGGIPFHEHAYWLGRQHLVMGMEMLYGNSATILSTSGWNSLCLSMAGFINKLLSTDWPEAEFIELYSYNAAILFHIDPALRKDEAAGKISLIGSRIADWSANELKLKIRIGLGGIKDNWWEISDSTEEAFLNLLQQIVISDQALRHMIAAGKEFAVRPVKFYHELAQSIVYSNEEKARTIVDEYIEQLRQLPAVPPAYMQNLCAELITIFSYSFYNSGITMDELDLDNAELKNIAEINTLEKLSLWLHSRISKIAANHRWNENSRHKEVVDFMIKYANEFYSQDINLEDMSRQIYLSHNYLNQIFKKATGETFTNYVIRIRMEKARVMLLEGKYFIYEIAEKVGYKNVPYFSNIFKKYNGFKPSEVRK